MKYVFLLILSPFVLVAGAINFSLNLLAVAIIASVGIITTLIGVPYCFLTSRFKKEQAPAISDQMQRAVDDLVQEEAQLKDLQDTERFIMHHVSKNQSNV